VENAEKQIPALLSINLYEAVHLDRLENKIIRKKTRFTSNPGGIRLGWDTRWVSGRCALQPKTTIGWRSPDV